MMTGVIMTTTMTAVVKRGYDNANSHSADCSRETDLTYRYNDDILWAVVVMISLIITLMTRRLPPCNDSRRIPQYFLLAVARL